MTDRKLRTRLPLTSRVWFFPTLILLMPLISRAGMNLLAPKPDQRRLAKSDEEICIEEYNECVELCGPEGTTEYDQCVAICYEEFELCIEDGPNPYEGPTCDPEAGYCGYDDYDNYDYGDYSDTGSGASCESSDGSGSSSNSSDSSSDWGCGSDDDYSDYDDSSTDWSCSSDDDYSDDSSDDGGWDCSADNYDEGDSGDGDWGEDWGERSPAGGDGIEPRPETSAPPSIQDF